MDRNRNVLMVLLALRLDLVSRARVLQAAASEAENALEDCLSGPGGAPEAARDALRVLAEALVRAHDGSDRAAIASVPAEQAVRLALGVVESRPVEPRAPRYKLGVELGRGGIGRVVEAFDSTLNREVAVKLVLDGLSPPLLKRFVREAEITARLEHPHIVPVHDFGVHVGNGWLGLCLKRVRGRNLKELIDRLAKGLESTEKYTLARLLKIFQDICDAIAFAHDRGVIHRDLKPSNVMIGDFGETLVVDWGLAREVGSEEEPATAAPRSASPPQPAGGDLTQDGDCLGTFAYMPPEQAEGRLRDVDRQSDIFSLGAILYEIIALRSPARETDDADIWTNAAGGRLIPPSRRASDAEPSRATRPPRPVPPELEAICLRAMSPAKAGRHPTVMALHDEVQQFLEGAKRREREHELAEACLRRAREARARQEHAAEGARRADEEAGRRLGEIAAHEDKTAVWEERDRGRGLAREAAEARAEADRLVTEALAHEAGYVEARALRAQMAFERFLEAEASGQEAESVLQKAVVEQFDDGTLRARLDGVGTLALDVQAYPCPCLSDGRLVEPAELIQQGYHRFSGRLVGGRPESAGLPELEPAFPIRLKVHGAACRAAPVRGARVWAWRYEERKRLLIPVTPPGAAAGPPPPVDRLFATGSPFRPLGPGIFLGTTPLPRLPMPMGSWLLAIEADGLVPARIPVAIGRSEDAAQVATLYRDTELGAAVAPVAAGKFHFQGDSTDPTSTPAQDPFLDDFALARFPVTCAEYLEWLNDLAKRDPSSAIAAAPREVRNSPPCWPGPPFVIPTAAWMAEAPPALKAKARRAGSDCNADWSEDWPVVGVSWRDAMRFAAWKRSRDGVAWTLPTEEEWEKAARGVDGRRFVCGPYIDDAWTCVNQSFPEGAHPASVTAFPHDESPYGMRGMAGNCVNLVLSTPGPGYPQWRLMRGGAWFRVPGTSRTTSRLADVPDAAGRHLGFRLARVIRLA